MYQVNLKREIYWRHPPVKTQDFTKNQDQDHADENAALVHVRPHTLITHYTDAVSSRKTSQADGETTCEMHEATEQAVGSLGIEVLGDEDGYDEGVDGDDTGHDNGDEAL